MQQFYQSQANTSLSVVASYRESRNNVPIYGYMLLNLSPRALTYTKYSVYNNNVAS